MAKTLPLRRGMWGTQNPNVPGSMWLDPTWSGIPGQAGAVRNWGMNAPVQLGDIFPETAEEESVPIDPNASYRDWHAGTGWLPDAIYNVELFFSKDKQKQEEYRKQSENYEKALEKATPEKTVTVVLDGLLPTSIKAAQEMGMIYYRDSSGNNQLAVYKDQVEQFKLSQAYNEDSDESAINQTANWLEERFISGEEIDFDKIGGESRYKLDKDWENLLSPISDAGARPLEQIQRELVEVIDQGAAIDQEWREWAAPPPLDEIARYSPEVSPVRTPLFEEVRPVLPTDMAPIPVVPETPPETTDIFVDGEWKTRPSESLVSKVEEIVSNADVVATEDEVLELAKRAQELRQNMLEADPAIPAAISGVDDVLRKADIPISPETPTIEQTVVPEVVADEAAIYDLDPIRPTAATETVTETIAPILPTESVEPDIPVNIRQWGTQAPNVPGSMALDPTWAGGLRGAGLGAEVTPGEIKQTVVDEPGMLARFLDSLKGPTKLGDSAYSDTMIRDQMERDAKKQEEERVANETAVDESIFVGLDTDEQDALMTDNNLMDAYLSAREDAYKEYTDVYGKRFYPGGYDKLSDVVDHHPPVKTHLVSIPFGAEHEDYYPASQAAANAAGFWGPFALGWNKDYVDYKDAQRTLMGLKPGERFDHRNWISTFGPRGVANAADINRRVGLIRSAGKPTIDYSARPASSARPGSHHPGTGEPPSGN